MIMARLTEHFKKVQAARVALLLDEPFFGVLALQLVLREDPTCSTMYTDGTCIGFAPAFVDTLTTDEIKAVIAHEVMHCACGHPWRRDSRDARKWNMACDYAINQILIDAGFKIPKIGLLDVQWKGKASEYIYARLPEPPKQSKGSGSGSGSGTPDPGGMGEVRDAPESTTDDDGTTHAAPSEADWQQRVQQSLQQAKMCGNLPANLARELGTLTEPIVDWRSLLRKYVQEITRSDYSWSQPNRRYLSLGLFLPQLQAHACGPIAVAVDTSGSIDAEVLRQFASEINAIAQDLQPRYVEILWCDARVHRVDRFERGDVITFTPAGGGGTDFAPVFAHYDAHGDEPACLIYLTDLYGSFPDRAPEYPVIWCTTTKGSVAPFGDTVPCLT